MKRRVWSILLVLCMLIGMLPQVAVATDSEMETVYYDAEQTQEIEEDLFAGYVEQLFYGAPMLFSVGNHQAGAQLDVQTKIAYDQIVPEIKKIAAGDRASTAISITYTNATDLDGLIRALLADYPYELYWYDKTIDTMVSYLSNGSGTIYFPVAEDYAAAEYEVDTAKTSRPTLAAANAKAIVDKYEDLNDYSKLCNYWDEICTLVDYNHAAAAGAPYGDPWQLVYVFDNDAYTKVVCEGYAKAFQYLCDMTAFDGDISCYSVSGNMYTVSGGGEHMWNMVTMEDGKNYLVDITNTDENAISQNGELFLAGGSQTGWQITIELDSYPYEVTYVYDSETLSLWEDSGILDIAETDYTLCTHASSRIRYYPLEGQTHKREGQCTNCGVITSSTIQDCVDTEPNGQCDKCGNVMNDGILASGYCGGEGDGTNLKWILTDDGVLSIGGYGAMAEYYAYDAMSPWRAYKDSITALVLEEGITTISDYAFYEMDRLTGTLIIPNSVTEIGREAFHECDGLTGTVWLSENVTTLGSNPFAGCDGLTGVYVAGANTTYCSVNGVVYSEDLTKVIGAPSGISGKLELPSTVKEIGYMAFWDCSRLTGQLVIPTGVKQILHHAFSGCSGFTGELTIPYGVTHIYYGAFRWCTGLTGDIVIPDSVTYLGYQVFMECTGFDGDLRLSNNITAIEERAFSGCTNLTGNVTIPVGVTFLGYGAFENCPNINTFVFVGSAPAVEGVPFDSHVTLYYIPGTTGWTDSAAYDAQAKTWNGYSLRAMCSHPEQYGRVRPNNDGTHTILYFCQECGELADELIRDCMDNYINETAEAGKDGICDACAVAIVLASGYCGGEDDGTNLSWTLSGDGTLTIAGSGAMMEHANDEWEKYEDSITKVVIEEGVTTIGYNAFNQVTAETITIPASVSHIDEDGIMNCYHLQNIEVHEDNAWYYDDNGVLIRISDMALMQYPRGKTESAYTIPMGVQVLLEYAFVDAKLSAVTISKTVKTIEYCAFWSSDLTTVTIPANVSLIEPGAFLDCYQLMSIRTTNNARYTSVDGVLFDTQENSLLAYPVGSGNMIYTIPDGTKRIDDFAFSFCQLAHVVFADSVTSIGDYAFTNGENISEIVLPGKLESIGDWAFRGCYNATGTLIIPDSVQSVGYRAFSCCSSLNGLNLGSGVTSIGDYAFEYCTAMSGDLTLPENLTSLGQYAFVGCAGFDGSLTIPSGLVEISHGAFLGCSGLTGRLTIPASVKKIGSGALDGCIGLSGIHFLGNAPEAYHKTACEASFDENAMLYYSPGRIGWVDSPYYDAANETWRGYSLQLLCEHETFTYEVVQNDNQMHTVVKKCTDCGSALTEKQYACRDMDDDGACDECRNTVPCQHLALVDTSEYAESSVFGKHILITTTLCKRADCGAVLARMELEEDCIDLDENDICDMCGAELLCKHAVTTQETVFDGYCTHTTAETCGICGKEVSTTTEYCTDKNNDVVCDICGGSMVKVNTMSMVLNSELLVNFNVKGLDLAAEDYVATITKVGTDVKNSKTVETKSVLEITEQNFVVSGTTVRIPVPIASKELADSMTIVIKDSHGNNVIAPYTGAARDYAMRGLEQSSAGTLKTLLIDMLNYGAASQKQFNHTLADLANSKASAYQKDATTSYEACVSKQDKGTSYGKWGAWQIMLESKIEMNVFWTGLSEKTVQTMYAKVSYKDHSGVTRTKTIPGTEFIKRTDKSGQYGVCLDFIAPADCRSLITVTAYKSNGSIYAVSKDSVEGYVARVQEAGVSGAGQTLYNMVDTMIKFIDASAAYLK